MSGETGSGPEARNTAGNQAPAKAASSGVPPVSKAAGPPASGKPSTAAQPAGSPEERRDTAPPQSPGASQRLGDGDGAPRSSAYDVAAALREQAGRAAQAARDVAQRTRIAVINTPIKQEQAPESHAITPMEQQTGVMAQSVGASTRTEHTTAHAEVPRGRTGRVRKARLRVTRVDPWSVLKISFMFSIAIGITFVVAVFILWSVLDAAGVFTAVGDVIRDVTSTEGSSGFQIGSYLALSRVLGFASLIAVFDVVLVTALATLGAFLYNLAAGLLGGVELTLAEDD